jgi:pimeloyl-ACP methyl ester carboxylesterase
MNTHFAISPDGARIAYDITGQGPSLMLLHGGAQDRQDWHRLGYVDLLKHDFAVITADLRGSGQSEFLVNVDDYHIDKICADVNAVADACSAGQFVVWGYSFGGNIARYLGAWSERVKAVAIIGVRFGPAVGDEFGRFIDDFVKKWGALAEAYRTGAMSAAKQKSAVKGRIPALVACFQAMRDWPSIDPDAVRCPSLLLAGTRNKGVMKWIASNRRALDAANVQIEIVDGLDHPQELSQVDQVYPRVAPFLKRCSGSSGDTGR